MDSPERHPQPDSTTDPREARIRGFDGLRGLSILMVVLGHCAGTQGFFSMQGVQGSLGDVANLGVRVFFVISGFLITSLLALERKKMGAISLRKFYTRRVLRLCPALYTYLFLVAAVQITWHYQLFEPKEMLWASVYLVNYHHGSWILAHLWSLSVEEQFYLIWPILFRALRPDLSVRIALAGAALGPIFRGLDYYIRSHFSYFEHLLAGGYTFESCCDAIFIGCFLALTREHLESNAKYRRVLEHPKTPWILLLALFILNYFRLGILWRVLGLTGLNIVTCLLLHATLLSPKGLWLRILQAPVLTRFGCMSYSLYIWQQPFLNRHSHEWINVFPVNLLLALVCALFSQRYIEEPFLRLKKRFEVASASSIVTVPVDEGPKDS